jgi:beta-alanine degradation protein BauB
MKAFQVFVLGTVVGGMVSIGVVIAAEPETDPVKLSPQLYDVRFENDRLRVLEYRAKPGQKEPMHSHPPGVVYLFSDSIMRTMLPDGTASETPRKAGELYWRDFTTHTAENIGETESHALAVELKPCR